MTKNQFWVLAFIGLGSFLTIIAMAVVMHQLVRPKTYVSGMAISDPVTGVMRVECFLSDKGTTFTVDARTLGITVDKGKARILVEEDQGPPEKYSQKDRWIEGDGICKVYVTNEPKY